MAKMRLFYCLLLFFSFFQLSAKYKNLNEAKQAINTVMKGVFVLGGQNKDNLDGKKLNNEFDLVTEFVKDAANGDKDLLNPLLKVTDANNNIVNTIKIVYRSYLSKEPVSQENLNSAKSEINKLDQASSNLLSAQKELSKVFFIRPSKKDARDLLNTYIIGLIGIIDQVKKNFGVLKPSSAPSVPLVQQSYPEKVYQSLGITKKSTVYQLFGLKNNAATSDVNSAYKKLSLKWHPDRNPNNPLAKDIVQLINSAKDCIINGDSNSQNALCRIR